MYLQSISNFRAFAIILIVAGHSFEFGFVSDSFVIQTLSNLITGSTAFFVFISGYMFHHVFYSKFDYDKFLKNKFKNVVVPYLLLSTFYLILMYLQGKGFFSENANYSNVLLFSSNNTDFETFIYYLFTGHHLIAYWYIPFAILLFVVSPFYIGYIKLSTKKKIFLLVSLSIISLVIHRPLGGTNPLHSLLYYSPFYMLGIFLSMNKDATINYLQKRYIIFIFCALAISVLQVKLGHIGNYNKTFFSFSGVDLMYLQKICLIFFFYMFFTLKNFNVNIINIISSTSFAIFFLHPWLIKFLSKIYTVIGFELPLNYNIIIFAFSLIALVSISIILALLVKSLFKKSKSTRLLIGY